MKLSDAIRKGCLKTQPGFGRFFEEKKGGAYACALGAAWIGITGRLPASPREANSRVMEDIWPRLSIEPSLRPAIIDTWGTASLRHCIMDLNDAVQWSREEIADWLDTLDIGLESA